MTKIGDPIVDWLKGAMRDAKAQRGKWSGLTGGRPASVSMRLRFHFKGAVWEVRVTGPIFVSDQEKPKFACSTFCEDVLCGEFTGNERQAAIWVREVSPVIERGRTRPDEEEEFPREGPS